MFSFNKTENPKVSIVTLLYNKANLTRNFLKSLIENVSIPFELILLNNASSDDTESLVKEISGATIFSSNINLQFIKGNNIATQVVNSDYILFLNNDIEIQKNTVESMLKTIETEKNCYAVASKIIFPTGKLQEAGSIVWEDGSCYGYGRGDDPKKSEYNYQRDVDYGSAACLLVRKDKFFEAGCFDERYSPAYYEDSDLCMKLHEMGGRVIYDPNAEIIHHEFSSSSPEAAIAKMIERQAIFRKKWENNLSSHEKPDIKNALKGRDRRKLKSILYIDDRIPSPGEGAGYPRAYFNLMAMAESYKITVFPKQDREKRQPWTEALQKSGIECICDDISFEEFSATRKDFYDLIIVSRPHNFEQTSEVIKKYYPTAKIIYDAEALFYVRERIKLKLRDGKEDQNFLDSVNKELSLFDSVDAIMLVSKKEIKSLKNERKKFGFSEPKNLYVIDHAMNINPSHVKFEDRKNIVFVGAFHGNDSPNEDSLIYFIDEIFPLVTQHVKTKLMIAGINPPKSILDRQNEYVEVLGFVKDLQPLYESARAFVIPHRFAGGIAWKFGEALSHGVPVVCTRLIANQFSFSSKNSPVLIGKNEADFAEKLINLITKKDLWETKQNEGYDFIRKTHNPEKIKKSLLSIIKKTLLA